MARYAGVIQLIVEREDAFQVACARGLVRRGADIDE